LHVSAVELGTQREMDGRVTGSERLRGRLLSSDLVRDDGAVRSVLRAAVGRDGVAIGARDVDAETLRRRGRPQLTDGMKPTRIVVTATFAGE
jgi:hypothetical protein